MRDLVRAHMDAAAHLMRARQQLLSFLLRHGRICEAGRKHWTYRHRQWLGKQSFAEPAQNAVFRDCMEAVWATKERHDGLMRRSEEMVPDRSLSGLVAAARCLRGLDLISATAVPAGVGHVSRFETPRQFMSFPGLTPSEHSSGRTIRRSGITKTGNGKARRMLIEAG